MAELPQWQPLNGVAPPMAGGAGPGRIVVLVASQEAARAGWAAGAAVGLARQWSERGHRVMLIDGGLDAPSLHTEVGIPNHEGLSDAMLYGASVSRVAKQVDGPSLFLITAGSPVGDPHAVVRSGRWLRLSSGILDAGVTLVLYVREGEGGAAAFLGSASDIVVLAGRGEPAPPAVRDLESLVRAVTGPGEPGEEPTRVVAGTGSAGDEATSESLVGIEPTRDPGDVPFAATPGLAPTPGKGGAGRMVLFVALMIAVAAALGYFFWQGLG